MPTIALLVLLLNSVYVTDGARLLATSTAGQPCTWLGHCLGDACQTFNDCDNDWLCINGKCASSSSSSRSPSRSPSLSPGTSPSPSGSSSRSPSRSPSLSPRTSPSPPGQPCSWLGHCLGDACQTLNDCDNDWVCINGKCSSSPAATPSPPLGGCPCGASWYVKPNDTLYNISIACGYSVSQLAAENNIVNDNYIWAGQRLRMPNCAPAGFGTSGGRCGVQSSFTSSQNGYTCPPSQCCSSGGWCGATTYHCSRAKGCNDKYGVCLTDGVNFQPNASQCSSSVKDAATWQLTSWQPGNASNIGVTIMTDQQCCQACTTAVKNGGTCLRGQPNGEHYYWVHIVDPTTGKAMVCDPWWNWWWGWGRK